MSNFFEYCLFLNIAYISFGLVHFLTSHKRHLNFYKTGLSVLTNLKPSLHLEFAIYTTGIGILQWLYWQYLLNFLNWVDLQTPTVIILIAIISAVFVGIIPSRHKIFWPLHWAAVTIMVAFTSISFILLSTYLVNPSIESWIPLIVAVLGVIAIIIVLTRHHYSAFTEVVYLATLVGWDFAFWVMSKRLF